MKSVLYLCRGMTTPIEFVFAPELPPNYYSPGQFIIEAHDRRGRLGGAYNFRAFRGDQELVLQLKRAERGRAYVVNAGDNGMFFFKVVALSRLHRYGGSFTDNFEGNPLNRLEPANMSHLERACRMRDFYFVGSSGR